MPKYIRVKDIKHPVPVPEDIQNAGMDIINRWALHNRDRWVRNDNNDFTTGLVEYGADATTAVAILTRNFDPVKAQAIHDSALGIRRSNQGAPRSGILESLEKFGIGEAASNLLDTTQRGIGYGLPAITTTVINPYLSASIEMVALTGANAAGQVDSGVDFQDVNAARSLVFSIPATLIWLLLAIKMAIWIKKVVARLNNKQQVNHN